MGCAPQVNHCRFPVSRFQEGMSEFVDEIRVFWRVGHLFLVYGDFLVILTKAGIRESEVVMPKRNFGVKAQSDLELLHRFQSPVRILISTPDQDMRECIGGFDLQRLLQLISSRSVLLLAQ